MFQFGGFASLERDTRLWRVGCPIRTSMDQRSCAAPHGFSQLDASFIAFPCLGIHRVPLRSSRNGPARHVSVAIPNSPVPDLLRFFFHLTQYVKEPCSYLLSGSKMNDQKIA
jgi:hypothetical protein